MLKAKDIMTADLVSVPSTMDVAQAAKILLDKGINGVPVVDGEKPAGHLPVNH